MSQSLGKGSHMSIGDILQDSKWVWDFPGLTHNRQEGKNLQRLNGLLQGRCLPSIDILACKQEIGFAATEPLKRALISRRWGLRHAKLQSTAEKDYHLYCPAINVSHLSNLGGSLLGVTLVNALCFS
jgi:hypothetical protein